MSTKAKSSRGRARGAKVIELDLGLRTFLNTEWGRTVTRSELVELIHHQRAIARNDGRSATRGFWLQCLMYRRPEGWAGGQVPEFWRTPRVVTHEVAAQVIALRTAARSVQRAGAV